MKIFRQIFTLAVLGPVLLFSSCSLHEQLQDTPGPDLIETEEDVTAMINGIYARFNDAAAFKFQGFLMLSLMADDLYSADGSEFGAYARRTLSSGNTGSLWGQLYYSISSANNLIQTLDEISLSPEFEKQAYGEAYFVRAFSYYYLVRLYGGVPLRLEPTDVNSDFYLPRSSVDAVYVQIFDDFKKASERLQKTAPLLGRATKGAAQALLSQAKLTYGNQRSLKGLDPAAEYRDAVLYADSVINSGTYDKALLNFNDLFDITKETNAYKEVIFAIRFQVDNQARAQPAAGSEFALRFMAPNTANTTGRVPERSGAGNIRPMPWFGDLYRTGDYILNDTLDFRNEVSFYTRGVNAEGRTTVMYPDIATGNQVRVATYLVGKYIDPNGKDERNNGNDFFVIRLAEVYLIKAEALNELNGPQDPDAIAAFNIVRARARRADGVNFRRVPLDIPLSNTFTKSEFRLKIFHERGLELVGEGQRWFDLVRMQHPGDPTKTMYEYQFKEELVNTAKYPRTLPAWRDAQAQWSNRNAVFEPALNVTLPKFLLFPLPSSEIINNPMVGPQNQNTGW